VRYEECAAAEEIGMTHPGGLGPDPEWLIMKARHREPPWWAKLVAILGIIIGGVIITAAGRAIGLL